jgi:hypothetical protein
MRDYATGDARVGSSIFLISFFRFPIAKVPQFLELIADA